MRGSWRMVAVDLENCVDLVRKTEFASIWQSGCSTVLSQTYEQWLRTFATFHCLSQVNEVSLGDKHFGKFSCKRLLGFAITGSKVDNITKGNNP